jgi:diguanylate cyclase (GGDEF)-like protein/PAS domain S-box-containing protein
MAQPSAHEQLHHDGRSSFARAWTHAVLGTSYVSMEPAEVEAHLRAHTDRLARALQAQQFTAEPAYDVGVALVDAHFTDSATLAQTIATLGALPAALGHRPGDGFDDRVRRLQGALAEGYAIALQRRTLREQEHIRRAAMTAKARAEQALRATESRFRTLFAGAPIGIGVAAIDGAILEVNHTLEKMLGYTAEEFRRRNVSDFMHPEDAASLWAAHEELIRGDRDTFRGEKRFHRKDGEIIWTNVAVSLVRDGLGRPQYEVGMFEDITERHHLQTRLRYQALHDPLTGLPNRTVFGERLEHALHTADEHTRLAVCFLDLDSFKLVNDGLGHDVGDQLLIAVARRLAGVADSLGCLVARLGGDEFVVLLTDTMGTDTAVEVAERLLRVFKRPFDVGGHDLTASASIGVVERRAAGTNATELLRAADITLQWAKTDGKGRWALFDSERNARTLTARSLSAAMPEALERGEFVVEYQPIVRLASGEVIGAEALVRWRHPRLGLLLPEQFIPIAEDTGLIVPLGAWVLEEACRQATSWYATTGRAPVMSVNVAVQQVVEPGLVDKVTRILRHTGMDPAHLQLEVTESAVMGSAGSPLDALHALADLGIGIAIDDLGTGYSNLSYLRSLPVSGIKLAGSFIEGLTDGPSGESVDAQIVAMLVSLARILQLTVTAEGVETPQQAQCLRQVGCDAGQGALFGAAGSPYELLRRMNGAT